MWAVVWLVAVVAAVVHAVAAPPEGDALVRRAAEEHGVRAVGHAPQPRLGEDKVLRALAHPLGTTLALLCNVVHPVWFIQDRPCFMGPNCNFTTM